MARPKSDQSNLSNLTIRLESRYISDLNLYAQAVGKNRSEILRSLIIEALSAIPEHQRLVMSVLAKSRQGEFNSDIAIDIQTKSDSFVQDNGDG
ncbi:hypothetical protein [uncultured Nostoc sp.]|uniref:hypothetical protein n=1 Tax=uncultured Nostoc sp. TaxID=340711 RepID=UPI0035CB8A3C